MTYEKPEIKESSTEPEKQQTTAPESVWKNLTEEELAELDRPEEDDYMRGRK